MQFTNNPANAFFTINTIIHFIKLNEFKHTTNKIENLRRTKTQQSGFEQSGIDFNYRID